MANSKFTNSKNMERFKQNIANTYYSLDGIVLHSQDTTDTTTVKIVR